MATVLASSLDGLLDDEWSDLSLYGKNHPLFSYLPGFMNERDMEEKRRILFEYPDLLGQSSLKLLGHFIVMSEQKAMSRGRKTPESKSVCLSAARRSASRPPSPRPQGSEREHSIFFPTFTLNNGHRGEPTRKLQ
ncbi:MAG TPA: hypothetical protein VER76_00290 [Pyrinomonadaceae bacterium]|nr:hypothetical protein [Pyrinomonadaceae bacterium]